MVNVEAATRHGSSNEVSPVFVFLDESGNFDFSEKGTRFFVLTAFITSEPMVCAAGISRLRYEFLGRALDTQLPFHASENSHGTRVRFIQSLCGGEHECRVHSIYGEKSSAYSAIQSDVGLYAAFAKAMGKYLLRSLSALNRPVALIYDSALRGKKQKVFLASVKAVLNQLNLPYRITFSSVSQEPNGQIADMYAWALSRVLERGDNRYSHALPAAHSAFNLFSGVATAEVKNDHPA